MANRDERYPGWNNGTVPGVLGRVGVTAISPQGRNLSLTDGGIVRLTPYELDIFGETPETLAEFLGSPDTTETIV